MRCVFYDYDAEGDETGYLHTEAEVWWDGGSNQFRLDERTYNFRFTPGADLSVLDPFYP